MTSDDAARKMAEEWAFALECDVLSLEARLRQLLAERDALWWAMETAIAALQVGQRAGAARILNNALTKHAAAGQPHSEGGEGSVAPGPTYTAPPSPAVAPYTPDDHGGACAQDGTDLRDFGDQ